MLRALTLTVLVFLNPLVTHAQSAPEATARQYLDAFNAGDTAKTASFNSTSGFTIIDEFAPYLWSGSHAFSDWTAGFDNNAKAEGITDAKVTLGPIAVNNAAATQAYLVFPAVYSYKQKGAAMRETAHMAFAMRKEGGMWKVAAFAWAGTVPKHITK